MTSGPLAPLGYTLSTLEQCGKLDYALKRSDASMNVKERASICRVAPSLLLVLCVGHCTYVTHVPDSNSK